MISSRSALEYIDNDILVEIIKKKLQLYICISQPSKTLTRVQLFPIRNPHHGEDVSVDLIKNV